MCSQFNLHLDEGKYRIMSLIARFMGPTWGPSGADRTQVGPMLAPWTLLSGVCTQVTNCFSAHERVIFGVYFLSCKATWEINTKITLVWAQKQFVTRVHAISYFLHDMTNPWMMIKMTIFTHHSRVSLTRFSFCWWRHNRLLITSQWPDNCDATTWIMISNSLDINFIHSNIHGWPCKNMNYLVRLPV